MVTFTPDRRKHISESMKRWYQNTNPELIAQHKAKRAEARTKWKWTEQEINILREQYPTTSARELSAVLNKTIDNIRTKTHNLGIRAISRCITSKGKKIHNEEYKKRLRSEYQGEGNPCWRGGKLKSYCSICDKELLSFPGQVKKYCSHACLGKANGKRVAGKRPRPWHIFTCEQCGKIFERIPSIKNARFCSKQCFGKYKISIINNDPELSLRRLAALQKKPTKPEARIIDILNKFSIVDWKYVGDGQVKLGSLYPDFINVDGKKKLIEVFGRGYHDPTKPYINKELALYRQEPYRKAIFASLGFDCLVLWDDEMKKLSDEEIAERIIKFTKSRRKPTAQLPLR